MSVPDPSDIRLRRDALINGFSDEELARFVRSGEWSRLRRGAYLPAGVPRDPISRHALLVHATMAALRGNAVVSHQSAAVLLGIPLWNVPLGKVHITRPRRSYAYRSDLVHCHAAHLRDDEVITRAGLVVTSPVRTVLDLARSARFESAVVAADAALHARLVDHERLRERLFDLAGIPGSRAAARVVDFADRRSESVGESRSRVVLHSLGIAPSTLQLRITTSSGAFLGRADFAWEEERLIGEFDGKIKYGRLLRPGQDPGEAVFQEKQREDAIRAEDWGVVRWIWDDLSARLALGRRVQRALERQRRRAR